MSMPTQATIDYWVDWFAFLADDRLSPPQADEARRVLELAQLAPELLAALKIYADKDNWTEEAVSYVLDGTVSASGNEGERRAVLLMDTPVVWNYSEEGYDVAQDAIDSMKGAGKVDVATITIRCICGRKHGFDYGEKRARVCSCGATVRMKNITPVVRVPENTIDERKKNGGRVVLKRPVARWGR